MTMSTRRPKKPKGTRRLVTVHTDVPPKVSGQTRCLLQLSVLQVAWLCPQPPDVTNVTVKWWGEDGAGAVFRPKDIHKKKQSAIRTTARYSVKSGPKQLSAYLSDMKDLIFEVEGDNQMVGSAEVDITSLSPACHIKGSYPVISSKSKVKIAELMISLSLQPLLDSGDSSSSNPTTDVLYESGPDGDMSVRTSVDMGLQSVLAPTQVYNNVIVGSNNRGQSSMGLSTSSDTAPINSYENLRGDPQSSANTGETHPHHSSLNINASNNNQVTDKYVGAGPSSTLLSALLDKGTRLKQAMVGAVESDAITTTHLQNQESQVPVSNEPNGGSHTEHHSPQEDSLEYSDVETTAVDLVVEANSCLLGLNALNGDDSSHSLPSDDDLSDLGDPLHDEQVLHELFYKNQDVALSSDGEMSSAGVNSDEEKGQAVQGAGVWVSRNDSQQTRGNSAQAINEISQRQQRKGKRALIKGGEMEESEYGSRITSEAGPQGGVTQDNSAMLSSYSEDGNTSTHRQHDLQSVSQMNVERLTLLGRVQVARVSIYTLNLDKASLIPVAVQRRQGKPPLPSKPSTYFIEYQFPVVSVSRDKYLPNTMATETMRVASKVKKDNVVNFSHHTVFPVHFDGDSLDKWWSSDLVFKVFSRPAEHNVPTLIGLCSLPLKSLLTSGGLSIYDLLDVNEMSDLKSGQLTSRSEARKEKRIGQLKVAIELASDSKDFSKSLAKLRIAGQKGQRRQTDAGAQKKTTSQSVEGAPRERTVQADGVGSWQDWPPLYTLVMIPAGFNIKNVSTEAGPSTPNTYLVCRLFWSGDEVTSDVCWTTSNPTFSFVLTSPVMLSQPLLDRLKNNLMVIEVWDKRSTHTADFLIGVAKISTHQFYMSYRDGDIAKALLKSQYPVVGLDGCIPITNPFTGQETGRLQVLLAMGSSQQVASLQKLKGEPTSYEPDVSRSDSKRESSGQSLVSTDKVSHCFDIVIEGIRGLKLREDMMWGEADFYVQYHFPMQQAEKRSGFPVKYVPIRLEAHKTATTLCVPDPTVNDVKKIKISLPSAIPVQREILSACSSVVGGVSGIPFEVWVRYYHPNIREQVLSKATLPLAKLCAMVTLQSGTESTTQSFPLTLSHVIEGSASSRQFDEVQDAGILDVTICYKKTLQRTTLSVSEAVQGGVSSQVCLSVNMIRASGLKTAADYLAKYDSKMQYPAEVGVDVYVVVKPSFMSDKDCRTSRTIVRTFAPELGDHMDFPCPLVWVDGDSNTSLAEILEDGDITFELWHKVATFLSDDYPARSGQYSGDVLLGTVTVPLSHLLSKKTGIHGWFPVNKPRMSAQLRTDGRASATGPIQGLDGVIGGLQLAITFAHLTDRDEVLRAASQVGWSSAASLLDTNIEDMKDAGHSQVTISVDIACFPTWSILRSEYSKHGLETHCYIRYNFYDKGAVCSKLCGLDKTEKKHVTSRLDCHKSFSVLNSPAFFWYLNEEWLEIQLWVSHGHRRSEERPKQRDRLIGSAYVPMETLARKECRSHKVSGLFPLFKPGVAGLDGAYIQVGITRKEDNMKLIQSETEVTDSVYMSDSDSQVPSAQDVLGRAGERPGFGKERKAGKRPSVEEDMYGREELVVEGSHDSTFEVTVCVERALHLSCLSDSQGAVTCPNSCVSYQTADSSQPIFTSCVPNSCDPVWHHVQECRLHMDHLTKEGKNLMFKVWHQQESQENTAQSMGTVIGFVSVDLSPLTFGLHEICGWYNVMDFTGSCHGQVMLSVKPVSSVEVSHDRVDVTPCTEAIPSYTTYTTSSDYPSFPSHLTRFTEQHIQLSHPTLLDYAQGQDERHTAPTTPGLPAEPRSDSTTSLHRNVEQIMKDLEDLKAKFQAKLREHQSRGGFTTETFTIKYTPSPVTGKGATEADTGQSGSRMDHLKVPKKRSRKKRRKQTRESFSQTSDEDSCEADTEDNVGVGDVEIGGDDMLSPADEPAMEHESRSSQTMGKEIVDSVIRTAASKTIVQDAVSQALHVLSSESELESSSHEPRQSSDIEVVDISDLEDEDNASQGGHYTPEGDAEVTKEQSGDTDNNGENVNLNNCLGDTDTWTHDGSSEMINNDAFQERFSDVSEQGSPDSTCLVVDPAEDDPSDLEVSDVIADNDSSTDSLAVSSVMNDDRQIERVADMQQQLYSDPSTGDTRQQLYNDVSPVDTRQQFPISASSSGDTRQQEYSDPSPGDTRQQVYPDPSPRDTRQQVHTDPSPRDAQQQVYSAPSPGDIRQQMPYTPPAPGNTQRQLPCSAPSIVDTRQQLPHNTPILGYTQQQLPCGAPTSRDTRNPQREEATFQRSTHFFPSVDKMEESMQTLKMSYATQQTKKFVSNDLLKEPVQRPIAMKSEKHRKVLLNSLPSAERAKHIAKVFSANLQ